MVRRHRGIISVERRKLMTSVSSTWLTEWNKEYKLSAVSFIQKPRLFTQLLVLCFQQKNWWKPQNRKETSYIKKTGWFTFTNAPMTPKLVSHKYSKGLDLLVVLRKGYRYNGMWAVHKNEKSITKNSTVFLLHTINWNHNIQETNDHPPTSIRETRWYNSHPQWLHNIV